MSNAKWGELLTLLICFIGGLTLCLLYWYEFRRKDKP